MENFDLVAQLGALVGTTVVLYIATSPREAHRNVVDTPTILGRPLLAGMKVYSAYHRQRSRAFHLLKSNVVPSSNRR